MSEFDTTLELAKKMMRDRVEFEHSTMATYIERLASYGPATTDVTPKSLMLHRINSMRAIPELAGHEEVQKVGWYMSAVIQAAFPDDLQWESFKEEMLEGLRKERDRLITNIEDPAQAFGIVRNYTAYMAQQ